MSQPPCTAGPVFVNVEEPDALLILVRSHLEKYTQEAADMGGLLDACEYAFEDDPLKDRRLSIITGRYQHAVHLQSCLEDAAQALMAKLHPAPQEEPK